MSAEIISLHIKRRPSKAAGRVSFETPSAVYSWRGGERNDTIYKHVVRGPAALTRALRQALDALDDKARREGLSAADLFYLEGIAGDRIFRVAYGHEMPDLK